MESGYFWMEGQLASDLIAITNNPADIDDGFWAISTSFDGAFTGAKFGTVKAASWDQSYRPLRAAAETNKKRWISSHTKESYCQLVEFFRSEIAQGNVYQVNACRILTLESDESIEGLVAGFLLNNPARYVGYLKIPGLEIASASPETFLHRAGQSIKTSPIKGTRKLGSSGAFPEKDESENIMIVDLMRNDLGRICLMDSITVPRLLEIENLPGLQHLVSDIQGTLVANTRWSEILAATLPPGSVSGAPKSSAIKLINKYENVDRGPYCGAFGWIHGERADLAVAIRTFWSDGSQIKFGTGAGITWASDAESEWDETELKAERLMAIAGGHLV